jgi:hypothetical protein
MLAMGLPEEEQTGMSIRYTDNIPLLSLQKELPLILSHIGGVLSPTFRRCVLFSELVSSFRSFCFTLAEHFLHLL